MVVSWEKVLRSLLSEDFTVMFFTLCKVTENKDILLMDKLLKKLLQQ